MHALLQSVIDIAARGEGKNRNVRVFVQRRFAYLSYRVFAAQTRIHLFLVGKGSVCVERNFKRGLVRYMCEMRGSIYDDHKSASSS